MRIAPIEKFGAIRTPVSEEPSSDRSSDRRDSSNPVVPTTAWTPLAPHQARLSRAASRNVKSTATSASASASATADDEICSPWASVPVNEETSSPA